MIIYVSVDSQKRGKISRVPVLDLMIPSVLYMYQYDFFTLKRAIQRDFTSWILYTRFHQDAFGAFLWF